MQVAQAECLVLARGAFGMFFRSTRKGSLDRRGHAGRQGIGWNLVPLAHHAARRHQRAGSHPRSSEHDRAHADQCSIRDRASLQEGRMADRHVRTDERWEPRGRVQHGIVLHVAPGADDDTIEVGTQDARRR